VADTSISDGGDAGGMADWAVNVVVTGGPAAVQGFLNGASEDALYPLTTQFYGGHADTFDFVYLLAEVAEGTGRYSTGFRAAMPENGLPSEAADPRWGSAGRLKGVVALRLSPSGNGPTLHETGHHWMNFLDRGFGFGQDLDRDWGPHWGASSVDGQLGGFEGTSLRCASGVDDLPPCTPEASGRIAYTTAAFGPSANGGDGHPYAPLELYLMGLIPSSEVTEPIIVLDRPMFIEELPSGRLSFEADGLQMVSIADIIAVHGEKTPLPDESRSLRGAFVLVTESPATPAQMDAVRMWSRIFAGDLSSPSLMSFSAATGGRASMDTTIAVVDGP